MLAECDPRADAWADRAIRLNFPRLGSYSGFQDHGGTPMQPGESPYLTTAEAAAYLRFRTAAGVRAAVRRGDLVPCGIGPRGTYLFLQAELDRFIGRQGHFRARLVTSGSTRVANEQQQHELSRNHQTGEESIRSPGEGHGPEDRQAKGRQAHMERKHSRRARLAAAAPRRAERQRDETGARDPWGLRAILARAGGR